MTPINKFIAELKRLGEDTNHAIDEIGYELQDLLPEIWQFLIMIIITIVSGYMILGLMVLIKEKII